MSATNRGAVRRAYDFYETPEEVTREFLFEYFEGDFHTTSFARKPTALAVGGMASIDTID